MAGGIIMAAITDMVIDGVITPIIMDTGVVIMAKATTVMVTGTIITEAAMVDIMGDTDITMGVTGTAIIPIHAIITAAGMGTVILDRMVVTVIMSKTDNGHGETFFIFPMFLRGLTVN